MDVEEVVRVTATPAALELIKSLQDEHGEILFHQSGGCCDGSAPMCYPTKEYIVRRSRRASGRDRRRRGLHQP